MKPHAAIALMLAVLAASAPAQSVYRCGNTYSQSPCPQGGKLVEATDPRNATQRAEAQRVVADERRLAAEMQRDRLAEQAALRPGAAASLSGAPARAAAATEREHPKKKKKHASIRPPATTDFIAIDPSSRARRSRHR